MEVERTIHAALVNAPAPAAVTVVGSSAAVLPPLKLGRPSILHLGEPHSLGKGRKVAIIIMSAALPCPALRPCATKRTQIPNTEKMGSTTRPTNHTHSHLRRHAASPLTRNKRNSSNVFDMTP